MLRTASVSLILVAACAVEQDEGSQALPLSPCQLETPGLTARVDAECGWLEVLEDRNDENGRRIELRVAVVPAVSRDPEPDPLVFLTGGPGQAATESYVQLRNAFRRIRRERDIVLVDQRGTGQSQPLRCPKLEDDANLWLIDEETLRPWIEDCLGSFDADPRFYTTSHATLDLDDVRAALGYERINIYGISYGTRAALSYLRRFPARVRSVIIDGVAPPTETLGVDVARDAQRALDHLVTRCDQDPICADAFPDVAGDLDTVMRTLEEPTAIAMRHPSSGEETTLPFHRSMAAFAIRLLTYSQENAAIVPLLLRTAASGDLDPLASQYLLTLTYLDESIADGMGFSVICSEDYPFLDPAIAEVMNEGTYLGETQTDNLNVLCPLWPTAPIPDDFKEPVDVDVPVLILSGEVDPVTPPENGDIVAQALPESVHIVAPGQGHMVIHRGCITRLASDFVEAGELDGLDATCVDDIAAQPFFVNFAGPPP